MTEQHVAVDQLAAYAAGDLDASAALEVEAHVLLCADCRADVAAVQRGAGDLAALEQVTMPADVAARVDAALAAERAAPAAAGGPVGDVLPMARKKRGPSFAGLAAVAAGVALVAAISVPLVTGRDEPSTTAGAALEQPTRRLASQLEYTAGDPRTALQQALGGRTGTPAALSGGAEGFASEDSAAPAAAEDRSTDERSKASRDVALTLGSDIADLRNDPARLAACVAALAAGVEPPPKPLVVDFAQFEGRPALIVVFPTVVKGQVRPDRVDFWAVGPRCGIAAGDDEVLHFARFGRPAGL